METSLHRQLKEMYAAGADARTEVSMGDYRIDAVVDEKLIEIQHGSLAAIRDKIRALLDADHEVLVVKPIVARKQIVRRSKKGGRVLGSRKSPKSGNILDLFDELVYFTRVFPHPALFLEAPLVEVEEWRFPGHGRRRRRRERDHQVEDQKLLNVIDIQRFHTAADLLGLIPPGLPDPFHTGHLAEVLEVERWIAQRVAYCFREMGATKQVGKEGNALLYRCV